MIALFPIAFLAVWVMARACAIPEGCSIALACFGTAALPFAAGLFKAVGAAGGSGREGCRGGSACGMQDFACRCSGFGSAPGAGCGRGAAL